MRLFGLNRRRSETLFLAIAQLVLIAYVFQVAAFDHWHDDMSGTPESSAYAALHADHCHGTASTCADGGIGFAQLSQHDIVRLPAPATALVLSTDFGMDTPYDAFISFPVEPPRAA